MILTCEEMVRAEEEAFARGVSAETLMNQAGMEIAKTIAQFYPRPGTLVVFAGKGHNGGDAFVCARELADSGWDVHVRLTHDASEIKELSREKLNAIRGSVRFQPLIFEDIDVSQPLVLLDGLLGIGAGGELRGSVRDACDQMNRLREKYHAQTVAIDLPSGLCGNSGEPDASAVVADLTIAIGYAKRGHVADAAINHVGRLVVAPLVELAGDGGASFGRVLTPRILAAAGRRNFDTHKGEVGRVGIVAGSRGMLGAGRLASTAAIKSGAGLVTWFVPKKLYDVAASSAPPEVMVVPIKNLEPVRESRLDALVVGPGLGACEDELVDMILADPRPAVIDADALNKVAALGCKALASVSVPRLLTPHPGEMARLVESWGRDDLPQDRVGLAAAFTETFPVALLLKGARTVIKERGRPTSFNSTGTPGMATGGMGDALSGIAAALLAQRLSPYDAGCTGSWLLGRAAEIALRDFGESVESLTAGNAISQIGSAFRDLRAGCY